MQTNYFSKTFIDLFNLHIPLYTLIIILSFIAHNSVPTNIIYTASA